eukprot:1687875-Prymnesium_polylepis.1
MTSRAETEIDLSEVADCEPRRNRLARVGPALLSCRWLVGGRRSHQTTVDPDLANKRANNVPSVRHCSVGLRVRAS